MTDFHFELDGSWHGSWTGGGQLKTQGLNTDISIDKSMGGPGTGTNPDELLLAAAASCYLMTLGIQLDHSGIPYKRIDLQSTGTVIQNAQGIFYKEIHHRPSIITGQALDPDKKQQLLDLAVIADSRCMVSNAIRGNIEVIITPRYCLIPH